MDRYDESDVQRSLESCGGENEGGVADEVKGQSKEGHDKSIVDNLDKPPQMRLQRQQQQQCLICMVCIEELCYQG